MLHMSISLADMSNSPEPRFLSVHCRASLLSIAAVLFTSEVDSNFRLPSRSTF